MADSKTNSSPIIPKSHGIGKEKKGGKAISWTHSPRYSPKGRTVSENARPPIKEFLVLGSLHQSPISSQPSPIKKRSPAKKRILKMTRAINAARRLLGNRGALLRAKGCELLELCQVLECLSLSDSMKSFVRWERSITKDDQVLVLPGAKEKMDLKIARVDSCHLNECKVKGRGEGVIHVTIQHQYKMSRFVRKDNVEIIGRK
eukprot:38248-Amorphochlora_amoeboformis.AAC.1